MNGYKDYVGMSIDELLTPNELREYSIYRDVCRAQNDELPWEDEIAIAVNSERNPYDGRSYE